MSLDFDIVVIGAGSAGLGFACSMAGSGQRIALVERHEDSVLAAPPDDGREIAITHYSQRLLRELGLWDRIAPEDIGTLRDARIMDDISTRPLRFEHELSGKDRLGWFVSNHAIRKAAWEQAQTLPDTTILTGTPTTAVHIDTSGATVKLDDERELSARLVVAADSRFSQTRRAMGVGAHMHDFGQTMLVIRVEHELEHNSETWQWFGHDRIIALLPLHDPHTSSLVVTLPPQDMATLLEGDDEALGASLTSLSEARMGKLSVVGPRCAYPMVATYAHRFSAERFALIGDAAVGMHPATAHGFNFGIMSQATLAQELKAALARGEPIHSPAALQRYHRRHRLATWPLYTATQVVAEIYTDNRAPARLLRRATLAASRLRPFRRLVVSGLTSEQASLPPPLRQLWLWGTARA